MKNTLEVNPTLPLILQLLASQRKFEADELESELDEVKSVADLETASKPGAAPRR